MAKMIGIDVSEHNGKLDWATIKKAGISFAIVRTGYGTGYTDAYFKRNIEGALAQGIFVGVYHFSYALDAAGARPRAGIPRPVGISPDILEPEHPQHLLVGQ